MQWAAFGLLSAAYFLSAILKARSAPLWMDEVLGVWIARLPTRQIAFAIWRGGEFSPPTYHLLLHAFLALPGACCGTLAPRLPSIVAIYGAAVCIFQLLRARVDGLVAIVAFGVVLSSALFEFAVQARQYALLTLLLAVALLTWTGFETSRRRWVLAAGLFLVLFGCVSLHFYGVVEVAAIGIAELLWLVIRRQVRWPIWIALATTVAASVAWLPLALHLAGLSAADVRSPAFYGRPTPGAFLEAVFVTLLGGRQGALLLVFTGAVVAIVARLRRPAPPAAATSDAPLVRPPASSLEILILSVLSLPLAAFAIALAATHAFSLRYAVSAALGAALAFAYLLDKAPGKRLVAAILVPLLAASMFLRSPTEPWAKTGDALAVIRSLPDRSTPIVVGEGLLFIQLMEAADARTRSRLVYVLSPPGTISPDPTNENQVKRLTAIYPSVRVHSWSQLRDLGPFLLLHRVNTSTDTVTDAMIRRGAPLRPVYLNGDTVVFAYGGAAPPANPAAASAARRRDVTAPEAARH